MAILDENDYTLSIINKDGTEHNKEIEIIDNGDTGTFFIGTVYTSRLLIGKKVVLVLKIVEDE